MIVPFETKWGAPCCNRYHACVPYLADFSPVDDFLSNKSASDFSSGASYIVSHVCASYATDFSSLDQFYMSSVSCMFLHTVLVITLTRLLHVTTHKSGFPTTAAVVSSGLLPCQLSKATQAEASLAIPHSSVLELLNPLYPTALTQMSAHLGRHTGAPRGAVSTSG